MRPRCFSSAGFGCRGRAILIAVIGTLGVGTLLFVPALVALLVLCARGHFDTGDGHVRVDPPLLGRLRSTRLESGAAVVRSATTACRPIRPEGRRTSTRRRRIEGRAAGRLARTGSPCVGGPQQEGEGRDRNDDEHECEPIRHAGRLPVRPTVPTLFSVRWRRERRRQIARMRSASACPDRRPPCGVGSGVATRPPLGGRTRFGAASATPSLC